MGSTKGAAGLSGVTGGDDMPEGYEQISPHFNPFWNPTKPMPYPVIPPQKETFPPAVGGTFPYQ